MANQFGHAAAAKSAEGRGATTSRVSEHVVRSERFAAEACPNCFAIAEIETRSSGEQNGWEWEQ